GDDTRTFVIHINSPKPSREVSAQNALIVEIEERMNILHPCQSNRKQNRKGCQMRLPEP
ncbi:hypothetical protein P7K49_034024, partial [Saguinus oedipus]